MNAGHIQARENPIFVRSFSGGPMEIRQHGQLPGQMAGRIEELQLKDWYTYRSLHDVEAAVAAKLGYGNDDIIDFDLMMGRHIFRHPLLNARTLALIHAQNRRPLCMRIVWRQQNQSFSEFEDLHVESSPCGRGCSLCQLEKEKKANCTP